MNTTFLIIIIYSVITFLIFFICIFEDFNDNFIKYVLLWPLVLIKLIIKELFKLLFTDWK